MPTLPGRPLFLLPCLGHTLDRGRGFSHCAAPFLFSCLFLQDLRLSRFPRPAPRVDLNHRALLCHLLRGLFLGLIVIVGKLGEEMRILYGVIAIGVVIKRRFRYLWSVNPWRREMHRVGLTKQLLCVFFEGCLTIKVTFFMFAIYFICAVHSHLLYLDSPCRVAFGNYDGWGSLYK